MIGIMIVALSAIAFSAMTLTGKYIQSLGVSTNSMLFLRFFLSAAYLGGYFLIKKVPLLKDFMKIKKSLFLCTFTYILMSASFFFSLTLIPAGLATMLLYTFPIHVLYFSYIIKKEPITKDKIYPLTVTLIGVILTTGLLSKGIAFNSFGMVLACLSAVFYSLYLMFIDDMVKEVSPYTSSFYIFGTSSMGFLAIAFMTSTLVMPKDIQVLALFIIISFLSMVALVALSKGIELIGPTKTSIVSTIEPLSTLTFGAIIYKEVITPITVVGGLLIIMGIVILRLQERRVQTERILFRE
jgi:drug/metabolite transporter (DMT)-like permease